MGLCGFKREPQRDKEAESLVRVQTYLISLYSCVMIPPALRMASLASARIESGVPSGYETMTAFGGATAIAERASSRRWARGASWWRKDCLI